MRFGFDEGLPGKAWAAGHPIILKEFENSYFKRTEAAKAVGLDLRRRHAGLCRRVPDGRGRVLLRR